MDGRRRGGYLRASKMKLFETCRTDAR